MKKYETPVLDECKVELEDIIAASGTLNSAWDGDTESDYMW